MACLVNEKKPGYKIGSGFVLLLNMLILVSKSEYWQHNGKNNDLPAELDTLLDGIEVDERLKKNEYNTLRDEMYASRTT
jgi:hypothetical protein